MLSYMFVVNYGIFLASNALGKIKQMETYPYDEEMIEHYRDTIHFHRTEDFKRALYSYLIKIKSIVSCKIKFGVY
jgi:hypothetical protein